ncbi:hypothetical protein HDU80_001268 [Chytriomyces hyalinus]|nr:hypothetical protein HDU80_001268 [Chytriomyces hyalinus]
MDPTSVFVAEIKNGRVEGHGKYIFPNGNVYVGEFKDGQFHGNGTIHFTNGGRYDASWKDGRVIDGKFTFKDGLVYEPENWGYCTPSDRRFYHEVLNGFNHAVEIRRLLKQQEDDVLELLSEIDKLRSSGGSNEAETENAMQTDTEANIEEEPQPVPDEAITDNAMDVDETETSKCSEMSQQPVNPPVETNIVDDAALSDSGRKESIASPHETPVDPELDELAAPAPPASSASSVAEKDSTTSDVDIASEAGVVSEGDKPANAVEERRRFKKTCLMVWSKLAEHRFGNVFTRAEKSPYYLGIIKSPMNLTVIKNRIRDGEIATMEEFHRDILQMLANAVMFNDENSEISHMAKSLKTVVEQELAAIENVRRMNLYLGDASA